MAPRPSWPLSRLVVVTLEPGARPHPPHRNPEEELMIVAAGTGEIVLDGVLTQVEAGGMMYAEANVLHGITNTGSSVITFYFTKLLAKDAPVRHLATERI